MNRVTETATGWCPPGWARSLAVPRTVDVLRNLAAAARARAMGTITNVLTRHPVAALTFDDGPHPKYTPRLLKILETHQARGTFFMVGEAAARCPELVRRVAEAGHAIGNHSWDHSSFTSLRGRERRKQIRACAQALAPYELRLFRPPYGYQSLASRLDALLLGYQVIGWSVNAEDWLKRDAHWMTERVESEIQPGSIVLFHDAIYRSEEKEPHYDRQEMLEAVNRLLERHVNRVRFVTIPELLRSGNPNRQNWFYRS